MNRVAIFSYDNPGSKTCRDIIYLINKIREVCSKVYVITNGKSEKIQKELSVDISIVDNIHGFDANRWQYCIKYLWKENIINDIDELVLLNDSVFGPFYEFSEIFSEMSNRELDFWGITYHEEIRIMQKNKKNFCVPKRLQTYFMVFNKNMIQSDAFLEFWNKIPRIRNVKEYQKHFEYIMTKQFEDKGFRYSTYIDTSDIDSVDGKSFIDHFIFEPYYLLKNKRSPLLSKHCFLVSKELQLSFHDASELYKAVQFVKEKTDYDENYILDYLIAHFNVEDIKNILNLDYIIDSERLDQELSLEKKVALYVHLYYEDLFDYCLSYLSNLPTYIDLYISTDNDIKVKQLQDKVVKLLQNKTHIYVVEKRGREWSAFLMNVYKNMDKYDYIGFIHDKKSSQLFYSSLGRNFCDLLWENVIGPQNYFQHIIRIFENNSRLGVLSAPSIYCGTFFHTSIDFWSICYKKTEKILDMLHLEANMSKDKNPIVLGTAFWCRKEALKQLFEYKYEYSMFPEEPMDIDGTFSHGLERVIPYVAQANGYMSGIIMTQDTARINLINKEYTSCQILKRLKKKNEKSVCLHTLFDLLRTYK